MAQAQTYRKRPPEVQAFRLPETQKDWGHAEKDAPRWLTSVIQRVDSSGVRIHDGITSMWMQWGDWMVQTSTRIVGMSPELFEQHFELAPGQQPV